MHVPLIPLGSALDASSRAGNDGHHHGDNDVRRLGEKEARLLQLQEEARQGWGADYVARVHRKKKLTARERIARLCDPGDAWFELGSLALNGVQFGEEKLRAPAAGVVTGLARIHGRICMVIANDNTVASGAWWPGTPEKIQRMQQVAKQLCVPVLYLVDCSGLFLPEQFRSFSGPMGAGGIFRENALLSAAGIPQVAGVFGDCIAGGGYMPIISDRVYMTEQAYMVLAGAALIKGAKSQAITSLDIGGPEVHVHQSGCADVRLPGDEEVLAAMREDVARLPSSAVAYHRHGAGPLEPRFPTAEVLRCMPVDHRRSYEIEQVIARLVDQSLFWEWCPGRGNEVVCGVARLQGLYVGIVANRQGILEPEGSMAMQRGAVRGSRVGEGARVGGTLYREGIRKMSRFRRSCEDDGIPIFWLQDVAGFDIGMEAERQGLLGLGSSLIYGNSEAKAPNFSVLLRRASGAGYYAMHGAPYAPVLQLGTVLSRLGVMEGRTLAIASHRTKLDDEFRIAASDPDVAAGVRASMERVEAAVEADMDPVRAASAMYIDELVALGSLRAWMSMLAEASYQTVGHRKVKNARIWSLHDA